MDREADGATEAAAAERWAAVGTSAAGHRYAFTKGIIDSG